MITGMEREPISDHDRLVRLHELLDRRGDSERSTEELVEALQVENALLREAFRESRVEFEDSRIDYVDVRVPRSVWLRLRAWRAADRTDLRPNRMVLFTDEELMVLSNLTTMVMATSSGEPIRSLLLLSNQVEAERTYRRKTSA
jgi:hypothetical protein